MKNPVNVRERLERARGMLKEYEGRVKNMERAVQSLERALKALEPRIKRAVDQTQVLARGVRAGLRAGAQKYRASRRT
jgi:chromosome segregation ATPase